MTQLAQRFRFDLTDALARHVELLADFFEGVVGVQVDAETHAQHLRFARGELRKDGVREGAWSISRFKGLGEMSAEQLWETTLNPDTRRLLPVELGPLDVRATEQLMTQLMGKGEAAARRELMELHGDTIDIDV